MKLTVLVPSQEYKSWAGARIRYGRIQSALSERGVKLTLEDIGVFDPLTADCDTVLISKCHEPKSLVLAAMMSVRGKVVGIDLFDDYFSDATDSRLGRYRNWLAQIVGSCDFALCSTEPMKDVVRRCRLDLPVHVMNDPAPDYDVDGLAELVRDKLKAARDGKRLNVAWFGIGDNAYFPVGLTDLHAFGGVLAGLSRSGMEVDLTILTNARALGAEGLSQISRLPVPTTVKEWSEEAEGRLLDEAFLAFLPVNAQGFSAAKSLNRAVTALSSGCQILSVGYPLYEALDHLIYRDAASVIADLAAESMRLSGDGIAAFVDATQALASADAEAEKIGDFLKGLSREGTPTPLPISLVHGHSTRADAHQMVQAAGGFSVASPFCSAGMPFDVLFRASPFRLDMLISKAASGRLLRDQASRLREAQKVGGKDYFVVDHGDAAPAASADAIAWFNQPLPVQVATYRSIMDRIDRLMKQSFGPVRTIVSETSRLPLFP